VPDLRVIPRPVKDEAYRLYVHEGLSVHAVAERTGVAERTLYKWRRSDGWIEDRDRYRASSADLIRQLDRLAAELSQALADSPDVDTKLNHVATLEKIAKIKRSIDNFVDRLPVALELIEDLCRWMRREAQPQAKGEIERLAVGWADDVRARWRERQ